MNPRPMLSRVWRAIEIFGLGYVGFPLSVRVSSARFRVTGIDTNCDRIQKAV